MLITFNKLHPKASDLQYLTDASSGFVLRFCTDYPLTLMPGSFTELSTGLCWDPPPLIETAELMSVTGSYGFGGSQHLIPEMQIRPLLRNNPFLDRLELLGGLQTISNDHRGAITVFVKNITEDKILLNHGTPLALGVITSAVVADLNVKPYIEK
jgi:dUTPase